MKRIILCICLFIFIRTQAQQINPVPDYVFSNKMSVGRNAVTDTAAYFSIGPRYGAIRGMMPPMVTDTASMSATKRNGLLIFSIQKNKYLYWDSVGSKWAEMAGTTGSALTSGDTASMLSAYIRAAGNGLTKSGQSLLVDTAAIATRARVQKAVDSLGAVKGSGTVTSVSAGTGMSFTTITSTGSVAADTTVLSTRAWRRKGLDSLAALELSISDTASMLTPYTRGSGTTNYLPKFTGTRTLGNSVAFDNGGTELLVNTTSDNGNYALQVAGSIYNTTGAVLAASSGNVGIGAASPSFKLDVVGNTQISGNVHFGLSSSSNSRLYIFNSTNDNRGEIYFDGTNNRFAISSTYGGSGSFQALDLMTSEQTRVRVKSDGEVLIGTTTDAGAYALQVAGAIYNTTTITTGAPTGGSIKPWRLGEAATVSPTSPNRTIRVEIDGTVYYIHAKTTND